MDVKELQRDAEKDKDERSGRTKKEDKEKTNQHLKDTRDFKDSSVNSRSKGKQYAKDLQEKRKQASQSSNSSIETTKDRDIKDSRIDIEDVLGLVDFEHGMMGNQQLIKNQVQGPQQTLMDGEVHLHSSKIMETNVGQRVLGEQTNSTESLPRTLASAGPIEVNNSKEEEKDINHEEVAMIGDNSTSDDLEENFQPNMKISWSFIRQTLKGRQESAFAAPQDRTQTIRWINYDPCGINDLKTWDDYWTQCKDYPMHERWCLMSNLLLTLVHNDPDCSELFNQMALEYKNPDIFVLQDYVKGCHQGRLKISEHSHHQWSAHPQYTLLRFLHAKFELSCLLVRLFGTALQSLRFSDHLTIPLKPDAAPDLEKDWMINYVRQSQLSNFVQEANNQDGQLQDRLHWTKAHKILAGSEAMDLQGIKFSLQHIPNIEAGKFVFNLIEEWTTRLANSPWKTSVENYKDLVPSLLLRKDTWNLDEKILQKAPRFLPWNTKIESSPVHFLITKSHVKVKLDTVHNQVYQLSIHASEFTNQSRCPSIALTQSRIKEKGGFGHIAVSYELNDFLAKGEQQMQFIMKNFLNNAANLRFESILLCPEQMLEDRSLSLNYDLEALLGNSIILTAHLWATILKTQTEIALNYQLEETLKDFNQKKKGAREALLIFAQDGKYKGVQIL